MRFEKKRVIVTAASAGIGFDIAKSFALEGAYVGVNGRRESTTNEACDKINALFDENRVEAMAGDIADVKTFGDQIEGFCDRGGVDIYVANAGITVFKPCFEVTPDEFDGLMNINLKGTYFSIQKVAKNMIENKRRGRIIIMSSVCGVQSHINLSVYSMSKAALIQLSKSLAEEFGPYGITVNVVAPGAILNERTEEDPAYREGWEAVAPNRRVGTTADVAHATLFLSEDMSRHIHGEVLMVDGGWTTTSPLPPNLATN